MISVKKLFGSVLSLALVLSVLLCSACKKKSSKVLFSSRHTTARFRKGAMLCLCWAITIRSPFLWKP